MASSESEHVQDLYSIACGPLFHYFYSITHTMFRPCSRDKQFSRKGQARLLNFGDSLYDAIVALRCMLAMLGLHTDSLQCCRHVPDAIATANPQPLSAEFAIVAQGHSGYFSV